MMDQIMFICECNSYTHQAFFWWDEEDKSLYVTIHLTKGNFFKRLYRAFRYVFGYKSNFGEWDEFLFKPEDEKKLVDWLESRKKP